MLEAICLKGSLIKITGHLKKLNVSKLNNYVHHLYSKEIKIFFKIK